LQNESQLDQLAYAFDWGGEDGELRTRLRKVFRDATKPPHVFNGRPARFALWRLFKLRDGEILRRVLNNLEFLAMLGWLVPAYLRPWIARPIVQQKIADYLADPDRNLSPYLSTWLMALMLDLPGVLPSAWVTYARGIALDRDEPTYHRAVALNVLCLGRIERDLVHVEEVIRREHDPELVRAAVVGLARVGRLTTLLIARAARLPGLDGTASYLSGRAELPSLILRGERNRIGR
jgi:hypothetical protein